MTISLDDMIGLSAEQRQYIRELAERAERDSAEKFVRLRGFFETRQDEDRKKLSYLFHNFRPDHEAARISYLSNISTAIEQTDGTGPWAVLFLYLGWMHLMVKRIERYRAGSEGPGVSQAAFVYAMF